MDIEVLYEEERKDFKELFLAIVIFSILGFIFYKTEHSAGIIVFVIAFLILLISQIKGYKIYNKHKKIKMYGERIVGTISDLEYRVTNTKRPRVYYRLLVKYIDPKTNEEKNFLTPNINFDPIVELGSFNCSVYIYNNDIYVGDIHKQSSLQTSIWSEEYVQNLASKQLIKKENIRQFKWLGLVILILFVISLILEIILNS